MGTAHPADVQRITLPRDWAPTDLCRAAFGVFNPARGVALLVASALPGFLRDAIGPAATMHAGAVFTTFAPVGLLVYRTGMPALAWPLKRG